ncbi:MAG: glycosyltransferase family A protein [Planctomycetaceae bacterium]|nr:glycosyltransferase family A protein [Planctomycetaceae bacterium]
MSSASVIVTTAPAGGDLRQTLQSVLAQTHCAAEITVVGNDPHHKAVVHEFGGDVRWLEVATNNVAAQRNAAIRRCHGELIALLDTHALWDPSKLARSIANLTHAPQDDIVYTPAIFIDPDGIRHAPPSPELLPCGWILDELFEEPWIADATAVFRKTVWERQGGFDEALTVISGQNFFLRAARAHRFAVIPEPLTEVFRPHATPTPAEHAVLIRETAEMLHRFYAEQGGDERLDSGRARRTLGLLCEEAARISWAEHNIPLTLRATIGALHYRPTWWSRFFLYWVLWRTRKERVGMNLAAG